MRLFLWTALVVAAILVLSCGDSNTSEPIPPPDPLPGWLRIRFNSPNTDDGGIMFTVSGGQIDSVRSAYPELFASTGNPVLKRIIVAGDLTSGGLLAEIKVPDVRAAADYVAKVEQVAVGDTFEQRHVSTYSLVVER